ncbi:hypothetical protein STRDD11_00132 [Streptococcus sp. DD11]|uniref:ATP-binding cassette domain-containing protein n=1 Tax=Streptococcus sp. DD11 TaxID=1777879 RepID=UPI00079BB4D2|nr:ABC transporter ATP-binding protein [Streptococcus sp. DD11]KXT85905.1 hypothetical protein STRDD11_00132 [Streptococcus sp. DD11]
MLEMKNLLVQSADKVILDRVSLSLAEGEALSIVGESGSGKSTLLKLLLGLPLRGLTVTEGSIVFEGQELQPQDHRIYLPFVGREVAWISQHASLSFNNRRKIKKHYQDLVKNQGQQAVNLRPLEECLEMVGLLPEKIVNKYPMELSGGMMQLVGVALALASRPKLLLADEPTSALDVLSKRKLLGLLSRLHQEEKMAILFVTHDISVAEHLAQRVAVMKEGRIVESGPAHQVLHHPEQAYTQKLLRAVPKLAEFREGGQR